VVPAFGNANPDSVLSCAGFLSDYGRWSEGLPAGEIQDAPIFNVAYRRSALLEFGELLESALSQGAELAAGLRVRGHSIFFEPEARIDHLNLSRPMAWFQERFYSGLLVGTNRAERWSLPRRLVYFCGSPLIPAVLLSRMVKGVVRTARRQHLPVGTVAVMIVGAVVRSVGEMIGYLRKGGSSVQMRMDDYELHKAAYVAGAGP